MCASCCCQVRSLAARRVGATRRAAARRVVSCRVVRCGQFLLTTVPTYLLLPTVVKAPNNPDAPPTTHTTTVPPSSRGARYVAPLLAFVLPAACYQRLQPLPADYAHLAVRLCGVTERCAPSCQRNRLATAAVLAAALGCAALFVAAVGGIAAPAIVEWQLALGIDDFLIIVKVLLDVTYLTLVHFTSVNSSLICLTLVYLTLFGLALLYF